MKTRIPTLLPLALAVQAAWADAPAANAPLQLDEVVVTSVRTERPLTVTINPREAANPAPMNDGASLLKTVPGISVVRKGGASGDPLLRGLGGSRLAIMTDGGFVYGGCGGRMDPPTAYIFPDAYDKVEIVKGPQSVLYGPGLVAGAVDFQRKTQRWDEAGVRFSGSLMGGSADRNDQYLDLTLGNPLGQLRVIGSNNHGGDYRDGDGNKVHSGYDRHSSTAYATLTPDVDTTLELSADRSRGQAAYADRSMDGSRFDRDAWGIKAERRALASWLDALRAEYRHSYVDHVMDNFSLRPGTPVAKRRLGNPDRTTDTARLAADLALGPLELTVGADTQRDRHTSRGGVDYESKPRVADQSFDNWGLFAQGRLPVGPGRVVAGLRRDDTRAVYDPYPGNDPLREQNYALQAAFARYELPRGAWTPFAGVGRAERAPDYWERNRSDTLKSETNVQLDTGVLYRDDVYQGSLSAYASRVSDFILVDNNSPDGARNVAARRYGLEGEWAWRFAPAWKFSASMAYAWGANRSDGVPLAQTPPLEGTLALAWDNGHYAAGASVRGVTRQGRVAPGQGNIASTDIGETPGFGVVSVNAGWRLNRSLRLTAGVDNLFNKTYAEHVSKGGAMVAGYERTTRVNEPGRTLWARLQAQW